MLLSLKMSFSGCFDCQTGAVHTDYYHDSDLTIGSVINVWGRKFLICDCDEFTKEYYKSKYGVGKYWLTSLSFALAQVLLEKTLLI